MSLVEIIITTGVFSLVVAGALSSAMMFVKITADHENRSDFASDMRNGMETMSFDVRNALKVTARSDTSYSLSFRNSPSVTYSYNNAGNITRTQNGQSQVVFRNVSEFDVLTNAADEPSGNELTYNDESVSIETLSLSASRGSSAPSTFSIKNFTLNMRND